MAKATDEEGVVGAMFLGTLVAIGVGLIAGHFHGFNVGLGSALIAWPLCMYAMVKI